MASSGKHEYTVYMLDLLKDCYNCFLLSLIEKHLNSLSLLQFFISYWEKFLKLVKFITQSYLSLLNFFLFLCTFFVFLNDYFFRWLAYKSLLSRFPVLINYMWSYNLFFRYPAVSIKIVEQFWKGNICSCIEKRLWHIYFPKNFTDVLRTPIL